MAPLQQPAQPVEPAMRIEALQPEAVIGSALAQEQDANAAAARAVAPETAAAEAPTAYALKSHQNTQHLPAQAEPALRPPDQPVHAPVYQSNLSATMQPARVEQEQQPRLGQVGHQMSG